MREEELNEKFDTLWPIVEKGLRACSGSTNNNGIVAMIYAAAIIAKTTNRADVFDASVRNIRSVVFPNAARKKGQHMKTLIIIYVVVGFLWAAFVAVYSAWQGENLPITGLLKQALIWPFQLAVILWSNIHG